MLLFPMLLLVLATNSSVAVADAGAAGAIAADAAPAAADLADDVIAHRLSVG